MIFERLSTFLQVIGDRCKQRDLQISIFLFMLMKKGVERRFVELKGAAGDPKQKQQRSAYMLKCNMNICEIITSRNQTFLPVFAEFEQRNNLEIGLGNRYLIYLITRVMQSPHLGSNIQQHLFKASKSHCLGPCWTPSSGHQCFTIRELPQVTEYTQLLE